MAESTERPICRLCGLAVDEADGAALWTDGEHPAAQHFNGVCIERLQARLKTAEEALGVSNQNTDTMERCARIAQQRSQQLETVARDFMQYNGPGNLGSRLSKIWRRAQALLGSEAPQPLASSEVERDVKVPSQGGGD